ncbi:MAG: N-acetylmuramic acid 6-phosphate etherase [Bacteroidetes bacterium]|nr:N-acetylmuramic acid 6-phosphate etherase [Bacteroidota bacterium]
MTDNHTESGSRHQHLEKKSILDLLNGIHAEDSTLALSVQIAIPQIETLCSLVLDRMQAGGRLFYIGAGTSGRLGIVDASECPPTYGVEHGLVVGIMAGGDGAMRKAVEFAEDDMAQGWLDLQSHEIRNNDVVVGISASGRTPYVLGALISCKEHGIATGCIVCNGHSAIASNCDAPVEVITGPEFVTGSTRMKAGTATKMVLNMITTSVMIKLGRVQGNKMVDMQLTNHKLIDRGTRMVMEETGMPYEEARNWLTRMGSVRKAVKAIKSDN